MFGADCCGEACDRALYQFFAYRQEFALRESVFEYDAQSEAAGSQSSRPTSANRKRTSCFDQTADYLVDEGNSRTQP